MSPRLVTLTLNPALDLASTADVVEPTHKIRTRDEHIDPGGGGINVARVIHALGGDAMALVLAGGFTGQMIDQLLAEAGVKRRILPIQGRTRISLAVLDCSTGQEYRFVPEGPEISPAELDAAMIAIAETPADWLIASGSLPRGAPPDIYASIARAATARGQRFVLDSSGEALRKALHQGVFLIKPSLREFEMLVGRSLPERAEREAAAIALVRGGAVGMVAVSLGAEGAMLASADDVIHMPALCGPVRSTVGAGDAFLASLVLALARGLAPRDALAWGTAAGAAAVAQVGTARVSLDAVTRHYERLRREPGA